MSFFEKVSSVVSNLFLPTPHLPPQLNGGLGRYIFERTKDRTSLWEEALKAYDDKRYIDAYIGVLNYLKNPYAENVTYKTFGNDENNGFTFELLQGSKKLNGRVTPEYITITTEVVCVKKMSVGFMRRLMEINYNLNYSRYALDDFNNILLKFHSSTLDGSPYKIFNALREIALHADKQDDLLADEFSDFLEMQNIGSRSELSEHERQIKYVFLHKQLESALKELKEGKLDIEKYPTAALHILLSVAYKLDYLTRPEGLTMEVIERVHRIGGEEDGKTAFQKLQIISKDFKKLLERSEDRLHNEFYNTTSTFSRIKDVEHETLSQMIEAWEQDLDFFLKERYDNAALGLVGFIVGNGLFASVLPKPDRQLLDLYYRITECEFFHSLGVPTPQYGTYLDENTSTLNEKAIKSAIRGILEAHSAAFPDYRPNYKLLTFESLPQFAKSYLVFLKNL
jgi:hypothetical protein